MREPYLMVTTTTASEDEANRLAQSSVEARLAACVQVVGPIRSTYWWKGDVERQAEWLCLMKTTAARFEALAAHIRSHHSYEVPEIVALPIVAGSPPYLDWISAEVPANS
jgi:periplasmic divalent cation tolerance protein